MAATKAGATRAGATRAGAKKVDAAGRKPGQDALLPPRGQDTRIGLLRAAERILIDEGIQALTVRRIGAVSTLNPTLVTYHFGSMAGLLAELCRLNIELMLVDWAVLREPGRHFSSMREVLEAWMVPLMRAAAFTRHGRTLIVLDEIASHGGKDLSNQLLKPMLAISDTVQGALRPFTPTLGARELRARVRFLSAAALGPPPRARSSPRKRGEEPLDSVRFLIDFAEASLSGGRADSA